VGSICKASFCLMTAALVLGTPLLGAKPKAKPKPRPPLPWVALERDKATIGKIDVAIGDVFDLANPQENNFIGRTADHLHMSTKERVIRRVLLFKEGDPVRTRQIYETERLLRALPFVKDAHIDPVTQPDGTVVAQVRVRDAWTTQVNAGFSSVGGQKAMNFGVDEKNFLGLGKSLSLDWAKDHERRTWGVTYYDPQLLGSRWTLSLQDQLLSDGFARNIDLERPFYALDTPWATGLIMGQRHTSLSIYDRGSQVYQTPFFQDQILWTGAVAIHEARDRVWRAGLSMERTDTHYGSITSTEPPGGRLLPPNLPDRRLRGPGVTLATQKDAFQSFVDLLGMDTPEDYNLAWNGNLQVGTYTRALGSSKAAPFFKLQATNGWSSSTDDLTLFTSSFSGRSPASGLENAQANLTLVHYTKLEYNQILAGFATVDVGKRLDPENWFYLGGDQGLRGFPNQLHPGNVRWLVSMDYRYLTEQRWWGIVRLGYNAFVDAGAIRQFDGQGWSKPYSDIGAGLRLGNLKSSLGRVILISIAAPLNREPYQSRFQFTIGNSVQF
jgi:outer membrane protein assembly factor BamA